MSLPQNYQVRAGSLWLNSKLSSLVSATPYGDATISVTDSTDSAYLRPSGTTNVLKVDITAPGTVASGVNILWSINDRLDSMTQFGFPYWNTLSSWTGVSLNLYFMKSATYGTRTEYLATDTNRPVNAYGQQGWELVQLHRDDSSNSAGGVTIADTYNRANLLVSLPAGVTGTFYIGPVYKNFYNRPKVVFTFDDGNDEHYSVAYDYMQPRGLVGGLAINSATIGSGANNLTIANMREMEAAGWTMHNHTADHENLTTDPDAEASTAECREWLADNGFESGRDVFIAPFGAVNTASDAILRNQGYSYCYATGELIAKSWDGLKSPYRIARYAFDNKTSAQCIAALNYAIKYGCPIVYFGHKFGAAADSATMATTEFQAFVDHVVRLRDSNIIDVPSPVELITGMANPRRQRAA